jgi:hypothetical protein
VRTRKPSGLVTPSGLLRLVSHAAMGVAMGLGFALLLMLIDLSGNTLLVQHGGSQGIAMSVGMLVLSFGIGATLTGAVFIMMEES